MSLTTEFLGNKIKAPLKGNKYLIATPEERVRQEFIVRLVNDFGFTLSQMSQEEQVNNSKRGQGKARADIVIWKTQEEKNKSKSPVLVIECKAEKVSIREEDYYQGYNYASWAGADFFITTNLKETRVFKVVKGEMPKKLIEIAEIPTSATFSDSKKLQELLNKTIAFSREDFSRLLFKCHNVIRNNDHLSPEAAFDEISKILFMKIRYERQKVQERALFSVEKFEQLKAVDLEIRGDHSLPFYQHLFQQTKDFFKDDELFETTDTIRLKESSFLSIVRELEKYNLSITSDDIKGIAFEEFLGKTFRGELGQFFTPRTIVDYMVDILDPQEGETICDPCCGSGGFLIKAFEYVRDRIEKDVQKEKENLKFKFYTDDFNDLPEAEQLKIEARLDELFTKLNEELNLDNSQSRLRTLSYDCIFGTDANPRMARTAKMNMIMHGDGHGGVHHHNGLLNVNGIFDGRFDVILTNPPFGSKVDSKLKILTTDLPSSEQIERFKQRYGNDYEQIALSQINNQLDKPLLGLFDLGKNSILTEVIFIERCLNLLKPGGRMGIVLPEGVLNNSALQRVREYVESKAKLLLITSIPQDVFIASGATVKPSVVFLKKFTEKESTHYHEITEKVTVEVRAKHESVLVPLLKKIDVLQNTLKVTRKNQDARIILVETKSQVDSIEAQILEEIKQGVKKEFDYAVAVVEVEKAGITSTGAKTDNELESVVAEFKSYRMETPLWSYYTPEYTYAVGDDDIIHRQILQENNSTKSTATF
ncbi:MAG: N-6 DNA methylase [Saprospiraceae bacterium]|nr:N-6 DNA methylase [Saprospiraceae bacterium]